MKKLLLLIWILSGFIVANAQTSFGKEMIVILENMKIYTIAVAEAMPEDKYDYKPTPEVRSFREQLDHIGRILEFHTKYPVNGIEINEEEWPETRKKIFGSPIPDSKEKMKQFLANRFDAAIELFSRLKESDYRKNMNFFFFPGNPSKSVTTVSMGLRDHITHHRAQAIVYLRLNGIEPPFYQLF